MSGRFVSARFRELGPSGTDQAIGIFSGHLDDAVLSDDDKPAPASSAEGPKVRRLAAGGSSQERTRLRNGISRPILALKKLVTVVKSSNKNSFATEHPA